MHLIPTQKQTQCGIAAHPPRFLSVALYSQDLRISVLIAMPAA